MKATVVGGLTEPLRRTLEIVISFSETNGRSPSQRAIAEIAGFKSGFAAQYNIDRLEELGYVERTDDKFYKLRVLRRPDGSAYHPPSPGLLVRGAAGDDAEVAEERIPDSFALIVKGERYQDWGMDDGDHVIVVPTKRPKRGTVVAVARTHGKGHDFGVIGPDLKADDSRIVGKVFGVIKPLSIGPHERRAS